MSSNVIHIHLSRDLETRARNALRRAIEMGIWRSRWRMAEIAQDYFWMDELQREYERVGLP